MVGSVFGQLREDGGPIGLGANLSGDRLGNYDGIRQRGE